MAATIQKLTKLLTSPNILIHLAPNFAVLWDLALTRLLTKHNNCTEQEARSRRRWSLTVSIWVLIAVSSILVKKITGFRWIKVFKTNCLNRPDNKLVFNNL